MLTTNVLCMKKRKKRRYCVSDVSDYGHRPTIEKRTPGSVVSMMHITEDTPPDMLAGAMDLTVHLPSGRAVKMSVERSTPMMDLLVQIVTTHQLQLSGHIIQALEMAPSAGISDRILPYKPNTPIGALDTQHIKVVPKNRNLPAPKNAIPGYQPFESTFRLKVHLPRNQLYVVRVSQDVYLENIMNKVCKEKDLDPVKYEFRHPGNLDEVLDPKLTLSDYKITEIYVVSKGTGRLTQAFSTSDIMALRKEEERKQFQAKTGGGVFNLIFKRGKPSGGTGSVSSDNRSISPINSDDSRSVTPPTVQPQILKEIPPEKPKPPQRKRRQAPKPPSQISEERKPPTVEKPPSQISNNSDTSSKKGENGLLICHSRNSSDSSGYHEASILSDHCNTSLPRRPRTMIINEDVGDGKLSGEHSKSTGNLAKMSLQSKSTSSLAIPGRKKKAAPPPPPPVLKAENSVTRTENASPVVASQPVETQKESVSTAPTNQTPPESLSSLQAHSSNASASTSARTSISNLQIPKPDIMEQEVQSDKENVNKKMELPEKAVSTIPTILEKEHSDPNISVLSSDSKAEADSGICENISTESIEKEDLELETDWQYQIPSPPKGFRDASPNNLSNCDTESVGDYKPDPVVSNPELFDKLKRVRSAQRDSESDVSSDIVSEENNNRDNDEICNKLSLENLEKRKSLVYNRELATSLKYAQEEPSRSKVLNELEEAIGNQKSASLLRNSKPQQNFKTTTTYDRNLPNFKISTYDAKKEKINIFEDDTVRSNSENKQTSNQVTQFTQKTTAEVLPPEKPLKRNSYTGSSMENIAVRRSSKEEVFKKPQDVKKYRPRSLYEKQKDEDNNVERSGSFSVSNNWTPLNPVKRSKSQVALNRYKEESNFKTGSTDNLSKSNSLFDVSGLQSLEVIRMIQTKLSNSKEQLDHHEPQKVTAAPPPVKEEPIQKPQQQPPRPLESTQQAPPPKVYYSPPSINLGTWSQRPKTQVQLKEDTDYKFSKANSKSTTSKLNTKVKTYEINSSSQNSGVSIKINGSDPILPQKSGNVVIKIGGAEQSRQISDIPSRYPLTNRSRPHSIALDSHFDISHVPIVRSVELKKPFKDLQTNNTSITQIYQDGNSNFKLGSTEPKSLNCTQNNLESSTKSSENKNSLTYFSNESVNKTVFRNNVFAPVVKGFKSEANVNKKTWSVYGTLPTKASENLNTNQNVPFSQSNLRRTESNKIIGGNVNNNNIFGNVVLRNAPISSNNSFRNSYGEVHKVDGNKSVNAAPPPPQMPPKNQTHPPPKANDLGVDQREQLLNAIRNFGGKKGLRTTKG